MADFDDEDRPPAYRDGGHLAKMLSRPSPCPTPAPEGLTVAGELAQLFVKYGATVYIAGVRQSGRTSLMMTMARLVAIHWQLPVTYISTEMSTAALRTSFLAGLAGIATHRVDRYDLSLAEQAKVDAAIAHTDAAQLHLMGSPGLSIARLKSEVSSHHPTDKPGVIFVDGLLGILLNERSKDPDFSVEALMGDVRIRSKSAFIASGWVDTPWREIANRRNTALRWTDVPEPVEWTFPHLVCLGKPASGYTVNVHHQTEGGGLESDRPVTVQGFLNRTVDAEEKR